MDIKRELNDYWTIALRQALGFAEIVRLKLRILGFSNKKSGLMAKLGEAAFKSVENGNNITDDSDAISIIDEIRESVREMSEAERAIIQKQEDGKEERGKFVEEKWSGGEVAKPVDDVAKEDSAVTESKTDEGKAESQEPEPLDEKETKQSVAS